MFLSFSSWTQEDLKEQNFNRDKWRDIRNSIRYEGKKNSKPVKELDGELGDIEMGDGEPQGYNGSGGGGSGSGGGTSSGSGSGSSPSKPQAPESKDLPEISPPDFDPPNFQLPNFSGLGAVMWVIIIVAVLALIAFLIYAIVKNSGGNKGIKSSLEDVEIHDVNPLEIPKTELELRLEEALKNEDYRECVRIYFIFTMKELAEKGYIRWEKEKTNMNYLTEVFGQAFFGNFSNTVSLFEVVWYGKREVSKAQYAQIEPDLKKCIASIE